MKLAEALAKRKQYQDHLIELKTRLSNNVLVQDGDRPFEEPTDLILEVNDTVEKLNTIIKQINKTNSETAFDDQQTISEALVDRDSLMQRRNILNDVINSASDRVDRYSMSEIKTITVVDVKDLIKQRDHLSRRIRDCDTSIQQLNWNVDLLD